MELEIYLVWFGFEQFGFTSLTPFDRLPLAILLNLLVVVGHSADLPQLLLPWLPYGKHGWEKGNSEAQLKKTFCEGKTK